ncbi:hypothetical protein C7N43_27790 [Sphingobacteriales bacterium UPWRP_1]|nr:hypothetical protein BVG80_07780 [Sphingobacteriales bacterium TSM_CSM]PSJ73698.1 hypothetical protein C7N43_27790 [Sphingobacteriales bacterium UPWRP_1]
MILLLFQNCNYPVIALLKDTRIPFSVLLLAYALLLNINLLLHPPVVNFTASAPLSRLLLGWLGSPVLAGSIALPLIFIVLVWLQAVILNGIMNHHRLVEAPNGLPGLFYLLLIALFNEHLYLSPPFFAVFGILAALSIVYNSYYSDNFTLFYDAGFAVAVTSLFYLPALLLVLFVFIGITVMRVIKWRQWVVVIMGVLTPYLLAATWFFLTNHLSEFANGHFLHITNSVVQTAYHTPEWLYKTGAATAFALFSLLIAQQQLAFSVVKVKKMFNVVVYLLLVSALTFAFTNQYTFGPQALLALPAAIFFAIGFYGIRRSFFAELLHLLLVGMVFCFQYFKYMQI